MDALEINFDGLIGPTHNYAGLSAGNLASQRHAGLTASPRAAALQGLQKMARLIALGVPQGFLPPPPRPATAVLRAAGFAGDEAQVLDRAAEEDPELFRAACSASAMWSANAATVIAEADTADGRVHLITANLATLLHRAVEAADTFASLRVVFANPRYFHVHPPLAPGAHFTDEGAANHMRLASAHGARGLNVFVHGPPVGGAFPLRQSRRAGEAVTRLAGLDRRGVIFAEQALGAIEAGAFHNDVVAVANTTLLLAHPQAFSDPDRLFAAVRRATPDVEIVLTQGLALADAVSSYLFNSQLVNLPQGGMALVTPTEVEESPAAARALDEIVGATTQIAHIERVDVRESMRNGGGPACLRLRAPVSAAAHAAIHPGYLLDAARVEALGRLVERHWPAAVAPADLRDPALWEAARAAHLALDTFIATSA